MLTSELLWVSDKRKCKAMNRVVDVTVVICLDSCQMKWEDRTYNCRFGRYQLPIFIHFMQF